MYTAPKFFLAVVRQGCQDCPIVTMLDVFFRLRCFSTIPVDTGCKLNVHKYINCLRECSPHLVAVLRFDTPIGVSILERHFYYYEVILFLNLDIIAVDIVTLEKLFQNTH